jgi:hypothetical protein
LDKARNRKREAAAALVRHNKELANHCEAGGDPLIGLLQKGSPGLLDRTGCPVEDPGVAFFPDLPGSNMESKLLLRFAGSRDLESIHQADILEPGEGNNGSQVPSPRP